MIKSEWENLPYIKVRIENDTYTYINQVIMFFHQDFRSIHYFRTLYSLKTQELSSIASYITICNSLYQSSTLEWLKLFNVQKKDHTYFNKIVVDKSRYLDLKPSLNKMHIKNKDDLKSSLLNKISISCNEFDEYVKNMIKLRNGFIAHTDLALHRIPKSDKEEDRQKKARLDKYPSLDLAEISSLWFYELIINILKNMEADNGNYGFKYPSLDQLKEFTKYECKQLREEIIST